MKKSLIWFLCFTLIFTLTGRSVSAETVAQEKDIVLSGNGTEQEIKLDHKIDDFLNAEEGSFSIRLKPTRLDNLGAVFTISNTKNQNHYFALWMRLGSIGIEYRDASGTHIINKSGSNERLADYKWHTITMNYDSKGIKVYGDGVLLFEDATPISSLKNTGLDTMNIGKLVRQNGNNHWPIRGLINDYVLSDKAMSTEEIAAYHQFTAYDQKEIMEEPQSIFAPGQKGSNNYRIPSLLKTAKGTLLGAIDKRHQHQADWGNIDIALRRSFDHGTTWEDDQVIIDLKSNEIAPGAANSAFLIDASMVQDIDPTHPHGGRIFMLVDMFPQGQGFFSIDSDAAEFKTPYVEVDGEKYLHLRDNKGTSYYVTEEGDVFNLATKAKSNYTVTMQSKLGQPYNDLGDLYDNGKLVGNIYLAFTATPVRAMSTIYLWLTYSDDDGATWSQPKDLTPEVKEDWMYFMGTGPGTGLKLENGDLVFPIYTTNKNLGPSQSTGMIGSSDNGETWSNYESVNDGRIVDGQVLSAETLNSNNYINTEAQVVQLNNGDLKMFSRNLSGKVLMSTSKDNGKTWEDVLEKIDVTDVYVQLSAIKVDRDGKEYIMIASASGPGRSNGTIKLLEVGQDSSLTLINETSIQKGEYQYNTLQQLDNGRFGVFYEHPSGKYNGDMDMLYKTFAWEDLGKEVEVNYEIKIDGKTVTVTSSNPIIASDQLVLSYNGGKTLTGKHTNPNTFVFEADVLIHGVEGFVSGYLEGAHGKSLEFVDKQTVNDIINEFHYINDGSFPAEIVDAFNEYLEQFEEAKDEFEYASIYRGISALFDNDALNLIDSSKYTLEASHGDPEQLYNGHKIGPIKFANDKDINTFWHAKRTDGSHEYTITVTFDEKTEVSKIKLLPRQDGSSNAMIENYEVYAIVDGVRTKVGAGTWAVNKEMKEAELTKVYADKIEFVVTKSYANTASAAEISFIGKTFKKEEVNLSLIHIEIEKAKALDYSLYTPETAGALSEAVFAALGYLKNMDITQEMVDYHTTQLREKMDQLVLIEVIDKDALEALVEEYKNLDLSIYTDESVESFNAVLASVEEALLDDSLTQEGIDRLAAELTEAKANLVVIDEISPKAEALKAAIEDVKEILESEDDYTTDSLQALNDAVDAAQAIIDAIEAGDHDYSVEDLDAAIDAIKTAKEALVKRTSGLNADEVIANLEDLNLEEADYEADSWNLYQDALADLQAMLKDLSNITDDQLQALIDALFDAYEDLVKVEQPVEVDTSSLDAALADALAIDAKEYTAESYEALVAVIAEVEELLSNTDTLTQEVVDALLVKLQGAIDDLVLIEDENEDIPLTPLEPSTPKPEGEDDEKPLTPLNPSTPKDEGNTLPGTGVSNTYAVGMGALIVAAGFIILIAKRRQELDRK